MFATLKQYKDSSESIKLFEHLSHVIMIFVDASVTSAEVTGSTPGSSNEDG